MSSKASTTAAEAAKDLSPTASAARSLAAERQSGDTTTLKNAKAAMPHSSPLSWRSR